MSIDLSKYTSLQEPEKKKESSASKSIFDKLNVPIFGFSFDDKQKQHLYQSLSVLLAAGLEIQKSLNIIKGEFKKDKAQELIGTIISKIESGRSLSDSLNSTGQVTPFEFYTIKIGEESGKLAEVLGELGNFYHSKIKQKRKVIQALSYPVLVMTTAVFAVWFMMQFVVPIFSDVFLRFGGDLPVITKWVLAFSELVSEYGLMLFFALVLIIGFLYYKRNDDWFRSISSKVLINIPVLGILIKKIYTARFCSSMSMLSSANVPIDRALDLVSKMVVFYPLEQLLPKVKDDVVSGMSLHSSLENHHYFDKRMISLLQVGEEVNQLPQMFARLSEQYSEEVDYQTTVFNNLLEPILIVVLGIVVGFILVALYLPIFKLSSQIM